MERLTKRDIDGCLIHPWSFNGINGSYDIWDEDLLEKQIDRLAAYEDSGLEPGEIYEVRFLIAAQRDHQKLARLRELVLADQNGKLVVLPCKVGDSVYIPDLEKKIPIKVRAQGISISVSGRTILHFGGYPVECAWGDGCGKDWFLTREEAEAALAGKGGEG